MKYKILLALFIFISSKSSGQQYYNKDPIPIIEIEKGIYDFDYLRAIFVEYGLKLEKKKDTNTEFWSHIIHLEYNNTLIQDNTIRIQVSEWKDTEENSKITAVIFNIDTNYLCNYSDEFFENIIKRFPYKKVNPIEVTTGNETKKDYELFYFRNDSPIEVTIEINDRVHRYSFVKMSNLK